MHSISVSRKAKLSFFRLVCHEHSNSWSKISTVNDESILGSLNHVFEKQEYKTLKHFQLEVAPSFVWDVACDLSSSRLDTDLEPLLRILFDFTKPYAEKCSALST